jgi:nitrogen permease regulator 3-like protein
MLSALSGTPRPYASFIPSKDHKETYFAVLAWLLRGAWVTQLRAFARIKVTPEIKMAVEQALQKDEMEKLMAANKQTPVPPGDGHRVDAGHDESSSSTSLGSQNSCQDTPTHGQGDSCSQYYPTRYKDDFLTTSSLILSPHRASPLESRWLEQITARFPVHSSAGSVKPSVSRNGESDEPGIHDSLKKYWSGFTKFFNGHDALEKISVRENIKRKIVWHLLMRMGLMPGQNLGSELDPKEQVLVSVRHW